MEDEKKKKRNKKKKNKQQQNKASEDDASSDHTINGGNAHHTALQNGAPNIDDGNASSNAHRGDNGFHESVSTAVQKQQLLQLQREGDMIEEISRLLKENESHIQKEADLEEKIKELKDRNDSHVQMQASLEDAIKALISANDICVVKEADFEEKINQFKIEKSTYMQKEADLEMKIAELQREKDLMLERETALKETIGRQNVDITRLRMQVVELDENKSSLLKENQIMAERISDLQSKVQSLETSISSASVMELTKNPSDKNGDLDLQVEAAHALVNKLIMENAELVEKVNELYVKLDQKDWELDRSSAPESDGRIASSEIVDTSTSPAESVHNIPGLSSKSESTEVLAPTVARIPIPSESDSAEIVQISLDESEVNGDSQTATAELDNDAIPLTDAPLIGAPFRLISFVASYVSGADLVNKS